MFYLIIITFLLPSSVKSVEWINEPKSWLIYDHICDDFSVQNWLMMYQTLFFSVCLMFVSLADDKNCNEGQVTILWTTFIKKWKYQHSTRGELTPVLGSTLTDLSCWEAAGLVRVIENHIHTQLLQWGDRLRQTTLLPWSHKQLTAADGVWDDKLHGLSGKPVHTRVYACLCVLEKKSPHRDTA